MKQTGKILKILIIILFSVIAPDSIIADEAVYTVRSIKILVGDLKYNWTESQSDIPEINCPISSRTIFSYTNLKPGMKISESSLDNAVQKFEYRLINSGLFYKVKVYVIPPKRFPESRTIMLKVEPGMLSRFGGGDLYAYWGQHALGGGRNLLQLYAGYNLIGVSYADANFIIPKLTFTSSALYSNSGIGHAFPADFHQFQGSIGFGCRSHPDFQLSLTADFILKNYTTIHQDNKSGLIVPGIRYWTSIRPEFFWDFFTLSGLSGKISAGCLFNFMDQGSVYPLIYTLNNFHYNFRPFVLSQTLGASWAFYELPSSLMSSLTPHLRAPADYFSSLGSSMIFSNTDLGFIFPGFTLFDFLGVRLEVFGFFDVAYLEDNQSFFIAFGPGLKIHLDSPVFVEIELGWGWNKEGQSAFQFFVR